MKNKTLFDSEIEELNKQIKKLKNWAWTFVWSGIILFVVGCLYWIFDESAEFNEVGDFIGGVVGSLWALAGLFFIYIAFLGQKVEIKYQQEDLTLTREELKGTKKVFEQQTNIMHNQQLDNTFFNLLDNHRKLVESFKRGERNYFGTSLTNISQNRDFNVDIVSGYEVLENKVQIWKKILKDHSDCHKSKNIFDFSIPKKSPVEIFSQDRSVELLYSEILEILNFIDNKIIQEDKLFYLKIMRNNLSFDERYLFEVYHYFFGKDLLPFIFNIFKSQEFVGIKSSLPLVVFEKEYINSDIREYSSNQTSFQVINYYIFEYNDFELYNFELYLCNRKRVIKKYQYQNSFEAQQSSVINLIENFNILDTTFFIDYINKLEEERYLYFLLKFDKENFHFYQYFKIEKNAPTESIYIRHEINHEIENFIYELVNNNLN